MDRKDIEAIVSLCVKPIEQYQAVSHHDARALLGEEYFARLLRDPIRNLGPTADTVYPWNVVDWLQMKELLEPA